MPLLFKQNINENSTIEVWRITESENFFLEKVNLINPISNAHKRLQHLAGRYVLHLLDPEMPVHEIIQQPQQKPFLQNAIHEFSISHCGDYAAAILSTKHKVGMDIETIKPKIESIVYKFLTEEEKEILLQYFTPLHAYTAGWSVKEALFKWLGEQGVDFKKHLQIIAMMKQDDKYVIDCIVNRDKQYFLKASVILLEEIVVVWVVG